MVFLERPANNTKNEYLSRYQEHPSCTLKKQRFSKINTFALILILRVSTDFKKTLCNKYVNITFASLLTERTTQKKLPLPACLNRSQIFEKDINKRLTFIPFFADLLIQIVV